MTAFTSKVMIFKIIYTLESAIRTDAFFMFLLVIKPLFLFK